VCLFTLPQLSGLYRDFFPNKISFDGKEKTYVTGASFKPSFPHIPE